MLRIVDYITRHGCPINYDGSRGENFGKFKIKDNVNFTNKQKDTLNFNIGRKISEEDIVDEISTAYYQNVNYWLSTYCNETDIMLNANMIQKIQSMVRQIFLEVGLKQWSSYLFT